MNLAFARQVLGTPQEHAAGAAGGAEVHAAAAAPGDAAGAVDDPVQQQMRRSQFPQVWSVSILAAALLAASPPPPPPPPASAPAVRPVLRQLVPLPRELVPRLLVPFEQVADVLRNVAAVPVRR